MTTRHAACSCGRLTATVTGEPLRISVCHCLDCQRRSGSAFAAQARFHEADVVIAGTSGEWSRVGDEGGGATFHFCPVCSATVYFRNRGLPGQLAIPIGAFADPTFPTPRFSIYENRKHGWLEITGAGIEHD